MTEHISSQHHKKPVYILSLLQIGSCVSLTLLSVRNNKLIELPSTIGQLVNLTIMNVVGNRLQELPIAVRDLTSLAALWITENQVTTPTIRLVLDPIAVVKFP